MKRKLHCKQCHRKHLGMPKVLQLELVIQMLLNKIRKNIIAIYIQISTCILLIHIPSNLSHLPYLKSVQSDITAMITINSRKRVIMNFDSILNFKLKSKQKN